MSGAGQPERPVIVATGRGSAFDDIMDEMTERRDQPVVAAEPETGDQAAAAAEPPGGAKQPPAVKATPVQRKRGATATAASAAPPPPPPARRRPAQEQQQQPTRGAGLAEALPMPSALDSGTTRPLNVRVPAPVHFAMKVATLGVATDMQTVVNHLVTVFLRDPELTMRLAREAESEGITLGEWVHDALTRLDGRAR